MPIAKAIIRVFASIDIVRLKPASTPTVKSNFASPPPRPFTAKLIIPY